jgi:hypothetical protein
MYGAHSEITVLHSSRYITTPIRYIRIKEGGTYDGALLQIYVDTPSNQLEVYLLGDNFQSIGWILKNFVPDGTDPGDVGNFSALTNVAAQVDLDTIIDGGMATTGEIYAGGNTTQYKVWHAGNDGSGSGLDADLLDGKHAGNADGNIPINNGTLNTNLNADLLDGKHASDFLQVSNIYYVETSSGQSYTIPNGTIIAYFCGGENLDITLPSPSNYIGKFLYVLLEFVNPSSRNDVTFFTQPGHFFIPGETQWFFVLDTSAFEGTSYKYLRGTLFGTSTVTNYYTFGFVFTALSSTKWALVARY